MMYCLIASMYHYVIKDAEKKHKKAATQQREMLSTIQRVKLKWEKKNEIFNKNQILIKTCFWICSATWNSIKDRKSVV